MKSKTHFSIVSVNRQYIGLHLDAHMLHQYVTTSVSSHSEWHSSPQTQMPLQNSKKIPLSKRVSKKKQRQNYNKVGFVVKVFRTTTFKLSSINLEFLKMVMQVQRLGKLLRKSEPAMTTSRRI